MPYEIRMQGGKHCVFNKDTGDNKGCSDSHAKAVAHMRALYAAEKSLGVIVEVDGHLQFKAVDEAHTHEHTHHHYHSHEHDGESHSHGHGHIHEHEHDHSEYAHSHYHTTHEDDTDSHNHADEDHAHDASYNDAGVLVTKDLGCSCLSCVATDEVVGFRLTSKGLAELPDDAFAYIDPDTGSRHFPISTKAQVRSALVQLDTSPFGKQAQLKTHVAAKRMGVLPTEPNFLMRIAQLVGAVPPVSVRPVQLHKGIDGRTRVLMRVSNNFKDRHNEIITEEAHKEYVDWVYQDVSKRMPEFWLWHIKGSRWGQADFIEYSDGFITASGLVDEGYEDVAEALADSSIGVSHGFYGLSLSGKGYIDLYRDFEMSPLPLNHAANIWTAMMLAKEAELPISQDKRDWLVNDVGIPEAIVTKWDAENKQLSELLRENGIAYKDDGSSSANGSDNSSGASSEGANQAQPTLADVMARLDTLSTELGLVKSKQVEFEAKEKDIIASALEAAIKPGAPANGLVASQSKDNLVDPAEADKLKNENWWNEVVMNPLTGGRV